MQRQERRGIESGIQRCEISDRSDHQAGAHEQHDRERELRDNQCAADPLRSSAIAAARRLFQRSAEIHSPRLQRGRESYEHAARDRHDDRERGNA